MEKPEPQHETRPDVRSDKHGGVSARAAYSVSDWRQRNQLSWQEFLWFTVPAGFAFPALFSGAWVLAGICTVLTVLGFTVYHRKTAHKGHVASATDMRKGDYPNVAYAAVFAPLIISPLSNFLDHATAHLTDSMTLPAAAGPVVGGVTNAAAFTFAAWVTYRKAYTIPRRRVARVLAAGSLEGVTTERIEAVEQHQRLINALVATGCGPGVELNPKQLARLMELDVKDLKEPLLSLRKEGIVTLQGARLFDDPTKWQVAITEDGIRCIDTARRR